eukprot:gnl/TRDRNA2_/TRDRNA2_161733_c0_seq1.p1 gnl/TRDRNA2_/TRDRNA2_161733_c0~~gnl/TRDRNA2_/TRDRNA2_161733_c0_seq1.p1  ORF type:complete len:174 (-),score=10.34 gnl/TRDRNA2_/TRDRNA2_161733_c0_seq1:31-552(-)
MNETLCAAALYSDAQTNTQNTFVLLRLLPNVGEHCQGSDDAVLCHLIQNSHNASGAFSPLRVFTGPYPSLIQHYEAFGCEASGSWMRCVDPKPFKCFRRADPVFDADGYFIPQKNAYYNIRDVAVGAPRMVETLHTASSIPTIVLVALCVGTWLGSSLRKGASIISKEHLMAI